METARISASSAWVIQTAPSELHIQLGNISMFLAPQTYGLKFNAIGVPKSVDYVFTVQTTSIGNVYPQEVLTHIQKWSKSGSQLLRFMITEEDYIDQSRFAVSPDGALVATGNSRGIVRLWSGVDGALVRVLAGPPFVQSPSDSSMYGTTSTLLSITFTPDSAFLVTGWLRLNLVQVWEVASGVLVRNLTASGIDPTNDTFYATALTVSSDGQYIVAAGGDPFLEPGSSYWTWRGGVRVWSFSTGALLWSHRNMSHGNTFTCVAISPDNSHVAVGEGTDANVRLFSMPNGTQLDVMNHAQPVLASSAGFSLSIFGVSFSSGGKVLISNDQLGYVRFWSVANGTLLRTLGLLDSSSDCCGQYPMHSSNGKYLYYSVPRNPSAPLFKPLMRLDISDLDSSFGLSPNIGEIPRGYRQATRMCVTGPNPSIQCAPGHAGSGVVS